MIFFPAHRLEKTDELLIGDGMDIEGKTQKVDRVARHLIASPFIAASDIGSPWNDYHLAEERIDLFHFHFFGNVMGNKGISLENRAGI